MIFFPTSAEEVSEVLKDRSSPIHISYDAIEKSHDTISLSKLNSILVYEPEEMIVSVQAGITLSELQKLLGEKNQWLPMLVAEEVPEETLGAAIVMDHYHPRSASMGMLRTAILGGTFSTTTGDLFKSGSRVVKSVAGYDIHRAFCGSKGLFGAIISVTLKVQPKPEAFFRFLTSAANHTDMLRFSPSICEQFGNELIVELAGYSEDIAEDVRLLKEGNLVGKELDQNHWLEKIAQIRVTHSNQKKNDGVAIELLTDVRNVFDPKGILR